MSIPRLQDEEAAELLEIIQMETGLIQCLQKAHGKEEVIQPNWRNANAEKRSS